MSSAPSVTGAGGPGSRLQGWGLWLLAVGGAFVVLNALLTFENRWPTAWVRLNPRLSFELSMWVVGVMLWTAWKGRLSTRALSAWAALFSFWVVARYADVTVPAIFGRPVNLYWDGRHAWEVGKLAASAMPVWQLVGGALLGLAGLALLYAVARIGLGVLAEGLRWHRPRPWLMAAGVGLLASYTVHPYTDRDTRWFFSLPVSKTVARQAVLLPTALSSRRSEAVLSPSPTFHTDVSRLRGADVLLVFSEAYGVTTLDHPTHREALAAPRERLARAVAESGRQVVSARVVAPTFGGSSWLAHAALLSGVDTRDPNHHDLLLTTQRPTLVTHLASHGWRTVGWMPGMQRPWPEGAFYRFERYADADQVGYQGPAFGYWRIPDQASMALLHDQELARPRDQRQPVFAVFPTVTTHAPFRPVAPYEPDWSRLLGPQAYSAQAVAQALAEPVSWLEPTEAYLQSMTYSFDWLAGYLRGWAAADLVTIVIGDHQPLASVTGPGASWDVPVHVISRDGALLQRFEALGFTPGLEPQGPAIGHMHELTVGLLSALDRCAEPSLSAVVVAQGARCGD